MTDTVHIPYSKFYLLSPDGFTLTPEAKAYTNLDDAKADYEKWKQQYQNQGYYSSAKHGRIALNELDKYMIINDQPFAIP